MSAAQRTCLSQADRRALRTNQRPAAIWSSPSPGLTCLDQRTHVLSWSCQSSHRDARITTILVCRWSRSSAEKVKNFPELIGLEKQKSQDTAQLAVRLIKISHPYLVVLMHEGKYLGAAPAQPPEAIGWR